MPGTTLLKQGWQRRQWPMACGLALASMSFAIHAAAAEEVAAPAPQAAAASQEAPAAEEGAGQAGLLQGLVAATPASSGETLPRLSSLFGLALENDSDLSSQRYELQATEQQVDKAWSQLKPQLNASAGYTYQESDNYYTDNPEYDPDNDRSTVGDDYEARYQGRTKDDYWQVSLSQPLFSVERWRGVDKAESQVEAARLQLAVGESELAMSVVKAYLNAFLASRKVALLESKRESLELQHRQASRSYELGVGDRLNVLESQSRLDQTNSDRVQAENELDDALGELERLTGRRPAFGESLGDLQSVELPGIEGSVDDWLANTADNLEVELADRKLQVAEADTSARRGGYYPELTLNLSYSDRDSNDPYRVSQDSRASVQLDMPLYQGGYTSADVRQGELTARSREASLTDARRLARQQVRQSIRNINGARRQLEALGQSIDSSRLFLEAAEKGEQLGLRDLVDVLDARAKLYDLRIQYIDALRQYLLERLKLEVAVGDLDTDDLMRTTQTLQALARTPETDG